MHAPKYVQFASKGLSTKIDARNPKHSIFVKICKSLPDLQVFQPLLGNQMVQADPVEQQQRLVISNLEI